MAKAKIGNSPLATLASRATTESATAPSKSSNVKPIKNYTGQFFFDRFVNGDAKEEQTRLDIVRQAAHAVDVDAIKASLNDMVELAGKKDEADGWTGDRKNKGPMYRNAANTRSVIQRCYGALRFAEDKLKEKGYTDKTGYHAFAIIAKAALESKQIKWNGEKGEDPETRAARLKHKEEEAARQRIQKELPRLKDEDYITYNARVLAKLDAELQQMEIERTTEKVSAEVDRLLQTYDAEMCRAIAEATIAALDAKVKADAATDKAKAKSKEVAETQA